MLSKIASSLIYYEDFIPNLFLHPELILFKTKFAAAVARRNNTFLVLLVVPIWHNQLNIGCYVNFWCLVNFLAAKGFSCVYLQFQFGNTTIRQINRGQLFLASPEIVILLQENSKYPDLRICSFSFLCFHI